MLSALKELPADEQKLIEMYYWDKQSMQKIGEAFAVTKMTVPDWGVIIYRQECLWK